MRRGKRSFEIEQLVSDVYEALDDDYPSAKIEKMWQTKQTAMTRILQANGGNKYNLLHVIVPPSKQRETSEQAAKRQEALSLSEHSGRVFRAFCR